MKILMVDDVSNFVSDVTRILRDAGLDASGLVTGWHMRSHDGRHLTEEDVLALVRSADVLFLDHNMPEKNGKELIEYWQSQGIDFSGKRVIGISSGSQPYLKEQLDPGGLNNADRVKQFLGL